MSRKLFAFLLSELKTVRVICKNPGCGVVSEMQLSNFAEKVRSGNCPACQRQLVKLYRDGNPLGLLAQVLAELTAEGSMVDLEFILPDDSE